MVVGMKKLILFSLAIGLFFFAGKVGAQVYLKKTCEKTKVVDSKAFSCANYALKNRPFTIVVIGHNNGANVEKTLRSVFFQSYLNFRLIYIDDASTDGSCQVARDAINRSERTIQVTFVQNKQKLGDLANVFRAVETCEDYEIVVVLKSGDWLSHEWVLQRLNAYYSDPDLWIALGNYIDHPTFQKGSNYDFHNLRQQPVSSSHLKTFYARLFKEIKESDLIYSGQFLPACAELAYMTPMLEMAEQHFHQIPEILYVHNKNESHKEDREEKLISEKYIRTLDSYRPLKNLEVAVCGESFL